MLWLDAEPSQSLPVTVETEVQGDGGEGRAGLGAPSVSGPGSMHTCIKWANGKEGRRKDGGKTRKMKGLRESKLMTLKTTKQSQRNRERGNGRRTESPRARTQSMPKTQHPFS